ncbi:MAG: hypothetical protein KAK01_11350, partial [Candidatus Marinimicrobia bacterium]|nr:hypothetical protein [Candidatus Neomarinimicrobiota bacterium]
MLITLIFIMGLSPVFGAFMNTITDNSFDSDGRLTTSIGDSTSVVNSIVIQDDGKIIAAGYYHNGTNTDFAIARYNSDGSLDTGFDTDGIDTMAIGSGNDYINAVALQSDGKIVVAG